MSSRAAQDDVGRTYDVISKWPTANKTLNPFSLEDGVLYVSGEKTAEAWDINAGKRLWVHQLQRPGNFRPRLGDGIVLFGGRNGYTAINQKNGEVLWTHFPTVELAVPFIHQGRVHFGDKHKLHTLDLKTGKELWTFETDSRASIWYAPTAKDDDLFLGAGDGFLYTLNPADGSLKWKVNHEDQWQYLRQIYVSGDILLSGGYKDDLYGIDYKNKGKILWRYYSGNFINSQLVHKGAVYFWSPKGWIYARSVKTGKQNWRHQTTNYRSNSKKKNWASVMSELVADEDNVYVLDMRSDLHVLDLKRGKLVGEYSLPDTMRPFLTLVPGTKRIFFGTTDGVIMDIRMK